MLRETLLSKATFAEAVPELSHRPMVNPLYFVVAGTKRGEGAVIARNTSGPALNNHSVELLSEAKDGYLAQTNWDYSVPITEEQCLATVAALDPRLEKACHTFTKLVFGDKGGCEELCRLTSDGRREAMVKAMEGVRDTDLAKVLEVMSQPPVLQDGTTFTALMTPWNSSYKTIVRELPPTWSAKKDRRSNNMLADRVRSLFENLRTLAPLLPDAEGVVVV